MFDRGSDLSKNQMAGGLTVAVTGAILGAWLVGSVAALVGRILRTVSGDYFGGKNVVETGDSD